MFDVSSYVLSHDKLLLRTQEEERGLSSES